MKDVYNLFWTIGSFVLRSGHVLFQQYHFSGIFLREGRRLRLKREWMLPADSIM